jgi:plastocyanin domain-containing protein
MDNFFKFGTIALIAVFGFWFFNQKPSTASATTSTNNTVSIVDGKQIVKMTASYSGYSPNRITIKAGLPVVWQITTSGNAGCASALVAPQLFSDMVSLNPDSTTTKEFTAPSTPGIYRFSCSMGMYTGTFEVIN